ncbi:MAG: extracellular solute-binding protein [Spirochaetaceae bacterium]|jgi:raffinose/stachyose/melibiose transport system substrate-binding protein|nr:extracellular solute-binding protein [Spirochaetaceae bacterium]
MKIAKKVLSVALVLVVAAGVAFAGGSKESSTAASGKTVVTVLNYRDLTQANSLDEDVQVWNPYRASNPNVDLRIEDLFNEPFHQKTEAYAAAGQLPDVVYAWPSGRSTTLHQRKLLKDLTPFVKRDGLDKIFVPTALDPAQQGGGYVAILPIGLTSSHAFYVNEKVLRDVGLTPAKTYAELVAQIPVLRAAGKDTILMANVDTWVMQSCLFSLVAGRFGGQGWEQKILSGQAKFTDPDFVNALAFINTMYRDGALAQTTLGTNYGDVLGQFATEQGAYFIDGDWRAGAFITDKSTGEALIAPDYQAANIRVTVFPDIEGAKLNKSTSGVLGVGFGMSAAIPAGSVKEEAAWQLVKWATGKETTTHRVNTGAIATPARNDIDMSALTLEPIQNEMVNLGSKYNTSTAVIDAVFHSDVFNPLNDGLQEIGMGTKTPEQVAAAVQSAFDTWKASN